MAMEKVIIDVTNLDHNVIEMIYKVIIKRKIDMKGNKNDENHIKRWLYKRVRKCNVSN